MNFSNEFLYKMFVHEIASVFFNQSCPWNYNEIKTFHKFDFDLINRQQCYSCRVAKKDGNYPKVNRNNLFSEKVE